MKFSGFAGGSLLLGLLLFCGCASSETRSREAAARANAQALLTNKKEGELYRIAPGDGLRIDFLNNEEMTRGTVVRPDGYISLPLIDDFKVSDKTIPEIRETLAERYKGILKKPIISVSVETFGGKIYVGGEVTNPGVFGLNDGVTALRAIAMAGGARNTAGLSSVLVIRDQGTVEPKYLMVDLKAGVSRLDGKQDVRLQPKDVVLVPKSRIATADQFVEQYMNQLLPFQKSVSVSYMFGRPTY